MFIAVGDGDLFYKSPGPMWASAPTTPTIDCSTNRNLEEREKYKKCISLLLSALLVMGLLAFCGAGDPTNAARLANIPVWTVHGAKDPTVPVQGSRDMSEAMQGFPDADFRYTELPDNEHDVWNHTYTNQEIFSWLFSQSKTGANP